MFQKLLVSIVLLSLVFLLGMEYPPRGTDYSSYRCSGGLVSKGDRIGDVVETCGEPVREDKIDNQPHRILIYRFDQSRVYYFAFLRDRLTRIYAVSCQQDDPNCE
jgi:hypothetical protein